MLLWSFRILLALAAIALVVVGVLTVGTVSRFSYVAACLLILSNVGISIRIRLREAHRRRALTESEYDRRKMAA